MDRRPQTWCDPWSFKQGDQFVVVGFSRKLTEPTLPAYPTTIPPIIPGMLHALDRLHIENLDYSQSHF